MQVFLVLSVFLIALSTVFSKFQPGPDQCGTTMEYAPVCGVNGKVYSNRGAAACATVRVDYPCLFEHLTPAPACGKDGITYNNECEVMCAKAEIAHNGECRNCVCATIYKPVCGKDGRTYSNTCLARCARVPVRHKGRCPRAA